MNQGTRSVLWIKNGIQNLVQVYLELQTEVILNWPHISEYILLKNGTALIDRPTVEFSIAQLKERRGIRKLTHPFPEYD